MAKKFRLQWWDGDQLNDESRLQTMDFEGTKDALQFVLSALEQVYRPGPWKDTLKRGPNGIWKPK